MKTITINQTEYWVELDGSDIVLESTHNRIVFSGGGDAINKEAEKAYYRERSDKARWGSIEDYNAFINASQDAWIAEYIDENITGWCKDNASLGVMEKYNLN